MGGSGPVQRAIGQIQRVEEGDLAATNWYVSAG